MATNMKQVLLKKKIDGIVYDLYIKTAANLVQVSDTQTLTQKLAAVDADVKDSKDKLTALLGSDGATSISSQIDAKVAALKTELTNETDATSLAGKIKTVTTNLNSEITRAKAAEKANADNITKLTTRMTTAEGKVTTLIGSDAGKSARTIANEELAKQLIPESASESLDTLQEIADWIQKHPGEASALNTAIQNVDKKVGTIPTTGTGANSADVIAYIKAVVDAEATRAKGAEGTNKTAAANAQTAANKANTDLAAEITRAKGAESTNATNISNLTTKVGTIPTTGTGANSASVIAYVQAMAADAKKAGTNAATAASNEATRAKGVEATLTTAVNARARFLVAAEQPTDLTESDVWAQIIE